MNSAALKKAEETQLKNIEASSGIKLDDWITIIKNSGFSGHGELVNFLKKEYGLGHGNANRLVHFANKTDSGSGTEDELVAQQYEGKEEWKKTFDFLINEVKKFGNDVEISPKKAYVSLRRKKQFAILQPSTKTRFDIGLNIKNLSSPSSLETAGSWNTMCTHRIKIEKQEDVTEAVVHWLREAYSQA